MSAQSTPILTLTVAATATLSANRFVSSVGAVPSADAAVLGVTRVAAASGDNIPVDVLGTTVIEAGGTFAAGDTLKTDNAGKAIKWATSGSKVAVALQAATSGQMVEILLTPVAA